MFNKKQINLIIGLLIFISSPFLLNASHIIGGKITYRYLGSNNYEIKLTVYRDCADIVDYDNPSPITVFDNSNNNIVSIHQVSIFHRDTLHPNNPDPCFIPPAGICVEEAFFLDTVLLPPNTSGYTVAFQRCCHNSSILNIIVPGMVGTTITANIPSQINNSATFLNYPPIYICLNDTFNYSFASNDIDGDSLVYNLCTPFSGGTNFIVLPNPANPPPYSLIPWVSGFSPTNPLITSGGTNFNINNGAINFIPTIQGQFAIGICVDEYRNGILLNTNRLEMQFNIVPCYLVSSIPTATNLCEGLNINFQNSSSNATNFHWDFGETTILTDTSNISAPNYTFSNYGTYTVSLIAINTSYGICKDTTTKVININPLLSPTIQPTFTGCLNNNNTLLFVGGAIDNSATFNWNLGGATTPSVSTINNFNSNFTNVFQNISVIVSQFGCSDTLYSTVQLTDPHAGLSTSNLNCRGDSLTFQNYSTNATSYLWDFGVLSMNTDTSTQISPTFVYPQYGIYYITLIAYNGTCSDTVVTEISVNDTLSLNQINTIEKQCLKNNSFDFFANGTYGSGAYFTWYFDTTATMLNTHQENPKNISYSTIGNHIIKMYVVENGCSAQRIQVIKILPNPNANFMASDTVGCQPLKISFTNQSTSSIPYKSTWQIENIYFNVVDTSYIFYNSGLYSIKLIVSDTNNCTDTLNKVNYINIFPKPNAFANVTPIKTSILNPTIEFIDNTLNAHTTNFDFGDNTISNQILNSHTYLEIGTYNYQLVVINSYGCSDSTKGEIVIDSYNALFIPNSFTPNNDGLNDIFKPVIPFYKAATLEIYNRWGDLILSTNNIEQGWDGKFKGTLSTNDIYVYKLFVEYLDGETKKIQGHISLIK